MPTFVSGTKTLFQNSTAGLGWTKDTINYNEHSLRVVSGAASSGGSVNFSSVFTSGTWGGTVTSAGGETIGATTLTSATIPTHYHVKQTWWAFTPQPLNPTSNPYFFQNQSSGPFGIFTFFPPANPVNIQQQTTSSAGGDASHTHPATDAAPGAVSFTFSGGSYNFGIKYVDLILATKN